MKEENDIPRLDLSQFVFTPPGPMGWTFNISEEDIENAKQGIQNIIDAEERLISLGKVYELSIQGPITDTQLEEIQEDKELVPEQIEPIEKIKIILPVGPLKAPWLPKRNRKKK